jgi:hypothetical protein
MEAIASRRDAWSWDRNPDTSGATAAIADHIGYSPYCVPRVVEGVKSVLVDEALRDIEPMAWDFVMNFARDNDLEVVAPVAPDC